MKPRINVIDLDKTLIPYDSFRVLIIREISIFNLDVIFIVFKRMLRILNQYQFKSRLIESMRLKRDIGYFDSFAKELFMDIDNDVLSLVKNETNSNTRNILISASPNLYVSALIKLLEWNGSGSYFDENDNFQHLYGKGKIEYLIEKYPPQSYDYHLSVSDSITDDELLNLFKIGKKWISQ
jgi:phosphoserine phosphatase